MQQLLIFSFAIVLVCAKTTFGDFSEGGHPRATSHQNIHIVHYHPVPTFIKKEFSHLLNHPISAGESSSSLEVDHGGKYDQGGDTKSSKDEEFDQGSLGENQSGFDENQGGGGFEHEDIDTRDGGDESFGGGYDGQYGNEEGDRSKGYQSDDGESEGSYGDNRRNY